MKRNFRRPLIVAGPKGVIRIQAVRSLACLLYSIVPSLIHPRQATASSLEELTLDDSSTVSRVALLSGKLYYDLGKSAQRAVSTLVSRSYVPGAGGAAELGAVGACRSESEGTMRFSGIADSR